MGPIGIGLWTPPPGASTGFRQKGGGPGETLPPWQLPARPNRSNPVVLSQYNVAFWRRGTAYTPFVAIVNYAALGIHSGTVGSREKLYCAALALFDRHLRKV